MHVVKIRAELVLVYGHDVMSIQVVRQWREKFLLGRMNVNDEERSRRPSDSTNDENIENVCTLLNKDYCYRLQKFGIGWMRWGVVVHRWYE